MGFFGIVFSSGRSAGCGWSFARALEIALFVGTGDNWPSFHKFFNQIFTAARWTFLRDGFVRCSEFALGIISASVERISFTGLLFDQITLFAERTFHANEILLHVFAIGISAA